MIYDYESMMDCVLTLITHTLIYIGMEAITQIYNIELVPFGEEMLVFVILITGAMFKCKSVSQFNDEYIKMEGYEYIPLMVF